MIACKAAGEIQFKIFLPYAATVKVVGDFTHWNRAAISMSRVNPGWWTVEVPVEPGDHEFGYLVDGNIWLADYSAHGVHSDRSGRWLSALHVDGPGSGRPA